MTKRDFTDEFSIVDSFIELEDRDDNLSSWGQRSSVSASFSLIKQKGLGLFLLLTRLLQIRGLLETLLMTKLNRD